MHYHFDVTFLVPRPVLHISLQHLPVKWPYGFFNQAHFYLN